MTLGAERKEVRGSNAERDLKVAVKASLLTKTVTLPASFWRTGLPRKVMVRSYFAESKGLVGCHYSCYLAVKVRDLVRFWKLNFASAL